MNKNCLTASEIIDNAKLILEIDSDRKFAKLLKITPQAVAKWRSSGKANYNLIVDSILKRKPDVNLDSIFKDSVDLQNLSQSDDILEGFNPIEVGAGDPVQLDFETYYNFIPVPRELTEPGVITARVRGDSMYPKLKEGTIILIDTRETEILSGEIYCINMPHEGLIVKRLFKVPNKIIVKSDNVRYPEFSISYDEMKSYENSFVVGRIRFICEFRK